MRDRADDVAAAMAELERARFLPPGQAAHAGEDRALPLFHGATGSQSLVHDWCLSLRVWLLDSGEVERLDEAFS